MMRSYLVFLQSSVPIPGIVDSIEAVHQRGREHSVIEARTASEVAISLQVRLASVLRPLAAVDHQFAHLVLDPPLELGQERVEKPRLEVLFEVGETHELCRQSPPIRQILGCGNPACGYRCLIHTSQGKPY